MESETFGVRLRKSRKDTLQGLALCLLFGRFSDRAVNGKKCLEFAVTVRTIPLGG